MRRLPSNQLSTHGDASDCIPRAQTRQPIIVHSNLLHSLLRANLAVALSLGPLLCYNLARDRLSFPSRLIGLCHRLCLSLRVARVAHLTVCLSMNCFSSMNLPSLYF